MLKPSLLFVQPSFNPGGGGNGVAAWMLQALLDDHACTLLTLETPDFDAIDRFYGTALSARRSEIAAIRRARPLLLAALSRVPLRLDLLKSSLLFAAARRTVAGVDLIVTANNEADLGAPAIQYVHYPARLYPRPDADVRWFHVGWLLQAYRALAARIQPASRDAIARNVTLVNSAWVGERMTAAYGFRGTVVHPPVVWSGRRAPWAQRECGFVAVGRLAPEKEFEKILRILAGVRARGHAVHLHVVAAADRTERRYARHVRAAVDRHATWVTLHERLSRPDLEELIATHRFGIHGMAEEHFGMAVAEMMRGACVVFVPDGGGQTDTVRDERLRYGSEDDAIDKICRVLGSSDQAALSARLARDAARFAPERFMAAIRRAAQRQCPRAASRLAV
jgi:glycosyltransferase involved in cell wall biosynthesis